MPDAKQESKPDPRQAEVEALRKELADARTLLATRISSPQEQAALDLAKSRRENAAKRADLKEATKKKDGFAYYRISAPFYRQSAYYEAGSVVMIPVDEEPSVTWEAVIDTPVTQSVPVAQAPSGRASDKSVA